jgi:hypothetical protein
MVNQAAHTAQEVLEDQVDPEDQADQEAQVSIYCKTRLNTNQSHLQHIPDMKTYRQANCHQARPVAQADPADTEDQVDPEDQADQEALAAH